MITLKIEIFLLKLLKNYIKHQLVNSKYMLNKVDILCIYSQESRCHKYIGGNHLKDKDFLLKLIEINSTILNFIPNELKKIYMPETKIVKLKEKKKDKYNRKDSSYRVYYENVRLKDLLNINI